MSDFTNFRIVRAAKQHRCDQCGKQIEAGEKHQYAAAVIDGDFGAYREHFECRDAWIALNFDVRPGCPSEGTPFLVDDDEVEPDEKAWMLEEFPSVAARLGWGAEPAE